VAEKKKRVLKQKKSAPQKKPSRLAPAKTRVYKPLGKLASVVGRKLKFLRIPDNRVSRFLGRKVGFIPRYFKESWQEISKVSWPNRRETTRLTIAVFVFAVVFTTIVAILDFGLDKLFREIIID
jgi:preprotein translocase SecE subunit